LPGRAENLEWALSTVNSLPLIWVNDADAHNKAFSVRAAVAGAGGAERGCGAHAGSAPSAKVLRGVPAPPVDFSLRRSDRAWARLPGPGQGWRARGCADQSGQGQTTLTWLAGPGLAGLSGPPAFWRTLAANAGSLPPALQGLDGPGFEARKCPLPGPVIGPAHGLPLRSRFPPRRGRCLIVAMPQNGSRACLSQGSGLQQVAKTVYWRPMHCLFIILAVVLPLAATGCAPATDRMPPDSVLNPRGT
jgi:hypothetical protein